jgi:hypothetical protein
VTDSKHIKEIIVELQEAGFMVFKVPKCELGNGHGRHVLKTRSAICEGKEPIPHGYQNSSSRGLLGGSSVYCRCGLSFTSFSGEKDTPWEQHKREFKICDCIRSKVAGNWVVKKHNADCTHPDAIAGVENVFPR